MTARDSEVLLVIKRFTAQYRHAPTIRELAKELDLSSTASVVSHLERLRDYGKIKWSPRMPRTIVVVDEDYF